MMDQKNIEMEIAELNYPEAPKLVTEYPGPKSLALFKEGLTLESPQRASGLAYPIIIDEAKGACLKDMDGNIFIDGCSGIAVSSVGHNHPKVVQAIRDQAGKSGHGFDLTNPSKSMLMRKMVKTAPKGLKDNSFVAFAMSGSDAGETAVKQAKMITGRSQICAFEGAYHGVFGTTNAMTTGEKYRKGYGQLMPNVFHVPFPYCYRCAFDLEYPRCDMQCAKFVDYQLNTPYTGKDDIAAIIAQGMQGEGGYIPAPKEWWPMMRQIADKNGCLLVDDEVQSGFGKTGKLWAIDHYDCEPDMIIFGKAVGGDQPVAGVITQKKYFEKLEKASQPMTFAGNAISMAVANANYDIMLDPETNLMQRAERLGSEFKEMVTKAQQSNELIGEVRGLGLALAIELVKDPKTKEPVEHGKMLEMTRTDIASRGLWAVTAGRYGNVLRFMPPLTITYDHFIKSVTIILEAIEKNKENFRK
ncbi:MAG: aspartate aminotransferase family protein [Deltaproteobacteria bacterium]|nr:aspartate aminotransferase family protein [Deltaproteobacteria bacterium]